MLSRGAVIVSAALCLAGYVWVYATGLAPDPIRSDGLSYYVYLPSWFLFHDTTLSAVARDCCGGAFPDFTAIIRWPGTRRWVNAHPIGVAIMQAPLFPVAHGLTRWTNLSPDGFSLYYQHAAGLAGLAWTVAGVAMLRRLLLRSFSDGVTAATLLAVLLGTNLYHYATFDSSYSHPYSFFLFGAFMWLTAKWYERPATRLSVLLGIVAGMIVLVRHTNVIFLVVFVLYGVATRSSLSARAAQLWRLRAQIARIAAAGLLVIAPQLLIYYQATGRVLVSSYGELGFNWTSPQIFGVLIGVQKGVFFWSPLLLLGVAGLVLLARMPGEMLAPTSGEMPARASGELPAGTSGEQVTGTSREAAAFVVPGALFLVVNTYLIASWWDWQFGGSYGHRGYVDALPLFALGVAAWFERASRGPALLAVTAVLVTALAALSMFQMLQYWYGIIPFSDTTWPHYREVFLRWR